MIEGRVVVRSTTPIPPRRQILRETFNPSFLGHERRGFLRTSRGVYGLFLNTIKCSADFLSFFSFREGRVLLVEVLIFPNPY